MSAGQCDQRGTVVKTEVFYTSLTTRVRPMNTSADIGPEQASGGTHNHTLAQRDTVVKTEVFHTSLAWSAHPMSTSADTGPEQASGGTHNHTLVLKKEKKQENEPNFLYCGTQDQRACCHLTATCARPSDARIATAASLFIGVLFYCAPRLQISRTPPDPRWIRRRRTHDHATTCSSAARDPRQAF